MRLRLPAFSALTMLLASAVLGAQACGGIRHVPPPATAQGYRSVELRDIAPLGLKDLNVELEAVITASGVGANEDCDLLTLETMESAPPASADAASIAAFTASIPSYDAVTLTLPRARYPEVRDLHPFDRVRVRGYLSTYFGKGCGWFSNNAHRYLWVDSIERVSGTPEK